jgi:hypothetical protein
MMKCIFPETAFRLDKQVSEQPPNMFPQLNIVIPLHSDSGFLQIAILLQRIDIALTPKEMRKEVGASEQDIGRNGSPQIVNSTIAPLGN